MANGQRFSSAPNTGIPPTRLVFDNLLPWKRTNTPFLSFFDSWVKALGWRKWLLDQGKRDIIIIGVWTKDLHYLYKAEDIVTTLRYNNNGQDRRCGLRNHRHEYLVRGGICADDCRILAVFLGDGLERAPYRNIRLYWGSRYIQARHSGSMHGNDIAIKRWVGSTPEGSSLHGRTPHAVEPLLTVGRKLAPYFSL
jgi:hypothetical protein